MVELYRMLYGDKKYDKPASLVFSWEWLREDLNRFEYDSPKLAQIIHRQFEQNSPHAIECDVNMIFTQCNQHPILGLMLYDANHGTKLASVRDEFRKSLFKRSSSTLTPTVSFTSTCFNRTNRSPRSLRVRTVGQPPSCTPGIRSL